MPYPKSAEQATFEWMPSLPFYSLGQSKYMCTRIPQTQLELKQKFSDKKLIERENLWIKPHIHLIKIKSHFSGTHFDDKCPTFSVASCLMIPVPIFAWHGFAKFGRNHIRDSHTVLEPYNLTCWQLTPLHDKDVLSWMSVFNLLVNENDFPVPVERHRILKSHDITSPCVFSLIR